MTDAETRRAILAAAATAPDMPVALVAMRGNWWGCAFDRDRYDRTDRIDPRDLWGDRTTAAEAAERLLAMDTSGATAIAVLAAGLVRHHEAGHRFDAEAAGGLLDWATAQEDHGAAPVALPPALLRLIGKHLRDEIAAPQGNRVWFAKWPDGWLFRQILRHDFAARRAVGDRYKVIIDDYAKLLGLKRSRVESIVSPKK